MTSEPMVPVPPVERTPGVNVPDAKRLAANPPPPPVSTFPSPCSRDAFTRGCLCERCCAHDRAILAQDRERRIREGWSVS